MKILIVDDERMALEEAQETVVQIRPEAEVVCAENYAQALGTAKIPELDIALLDIEMPGMSGLGLAKKLKEYNPNINIIFVTAYAEYALDAFSMYASGYLLKPIRAEELERAFANLRHPVEDQGTKLKVQCFGNFEVFYEGKPVHFARARAKEIFAYLVDLNGSTANTGELCGILFEDSRETEKNRHYIRNLISDIRRALHVCHADDVFISKRNQFSIVPDKIDCDYYRFLKKDAMAVNSYRGEYMKQYSWAEFSMKYFE